MNRTDLCPECGLQMQFHGLGGIYTCTFRDESDLTPQLVGLEGWRVEVEDYDLARPRRFYVGKSTGWRPCHLEVLTSRSRGGSPAAKHYFSVKKLNIRKTK